MHLNMTDTTKIKVDGNELELVPTLAALECLNKKYGDFANVLNGINSLNFDTYIDVIYVGVKKQLPSNEKERKETAQEIFNTGIVDLLAPVTEYIMLLLNGGRKIDPEEEQEATNPKI